jgi:hypothetical protein
VLVAALASIPAMFLSVASGVWGATGRVIDVASGVVLVAETVILLVVAQDKRAWIRGHLGLIAFTLLVVAAVVFAVGPVQVLRLVRTIGALRILRARRILRAARALGNRTGLAHAMSAGAGLLVTVFVGVVLSDPTSRSNDLLEQVVGQVSTFTVVLTSALAGLVLGAATFLLARDRGSGPDAEDEAGT